MTVDAPEIAQYLCPACKGNKVIPVEVKRNVMTVYEFCRTCYGEGFLWR